MWDICCVLSMFLWLYSKRCIWLNHQPAVFPSVCQPQYVKSHSWHCSICNTQLLLTAQTSVTSESTSGAAPLRLFVSQLMGVCVRLRKLLNITVLNQLKEKLDLFLVILNRDSLIQPMDPGRKRRMFFIAVCICDPPAYIQPPTCLFHFINKCTA